MKNHTKMRIRVWLLDFPVFLVLFVPVVALWGSAMVIEAFREHVDGLMRFGEGVDDWNSKHPEDPSPNTWF